MYILQRSQILATDRESAWGFLRNPYNLNRITPPDLDFTIISAPSEEMFDGQIIEYSIRIPLIGRQHWVTEIKHIRQYHSFVDEQRLGPYAFWYHQHTIVPVAEGVESSDTVYYTLPYGIAGVLLEKLFIRRTLDRIFDFRKEALAEIFS